MKIDRIKMQNFRGKTSEIELGDRTFLSGENGSGKSTIMCVPHFTVSGKLPSYKSSESFLNASDGNMMGGVTIDGHDIMRTLTQGESLSEKLVIDGEEMGVKAAEPVLRVLLGQGPVLLDMPAFYACSPRDKRLMVLGLTASKEEQEAIFKETEKARTDANEATSDRHAAEKALELTTEQVAECERPVGSVSELQKEEDGLNEALDELTKKMSDGEANDKLKAQYKEDAEGLEEGKKAEAKNEGRMVAIRKTIESFEETIENDKEPAREQDIDPLTDVQVEEIEKAIDLLAPVDHNDAVEASEVLSGMLPDSKGLEAWMKAHNEWNVRLEQHGAVLAKARIDLEETAQALQASKDSVRLGIEASSKLAQVGPSLDKNDIAIKAGMVDRRKCLKEKISVLQKVETLEKSMEGHRISAQKRGEEEAKAKEALKTAIAKQADMVSKAVEALSLFSKSILPDGELEIRDDGKSFDIIWLREDGRKINRQTLSGGEQGLFDAALGHSLAPEATVLIEAGEIDHDHMIEMFESLNGCDFQIIVASWYDPYYHNEKVIPEGWNHIEMS